MVLTNILLKNATPKTKPYKVFDGQGLYVVVTPAGNKLWRFDYSINRKRKTLSLGMYPAVSLKEARIKRDEAKVLLSKGVDPSTAKGKTGNQKLTFGELAIEWYNKRKGTWMPRHDKTVEQRIRLYILPTIGKRAVSDITAPELYAVLRVIEESGKIETAHRVKQIISMIFRYGIIKGEADRDPVADLGRGVLTPSKPKHYPTILDPKQIGALMRAIDGYEYLLVRYAMKLLAYTFVRPGELRHAEWQEIKFNDSLWEIPAEKMKMKKEHIVPLSRQAIEVLRLIHRFTGDGVYVFPGTRGKDRPISDVTINAALQRMGYDTKKDITAHGFRAMARTILHERLRFPAEVIEHQLAHAVPDALGEAYNRTKFIEERKEMMQAWADYLDTLKESCSLPNF